MIQDSPAGNQPTQTETHNGGTGIQPIAFEPISASRRRPGLSLRPAAILIAILLLAALLVIWFLLTARSLVISLEPTTAKAVAKIQLKGGIALRLAEHYLVRPGEYRIDASAPGYFPFSEPVVVTSNDNQEFRVKLQKLPGRLRVTSNIPSTELFLDGEFRGQLPMMLEEIVPGTHRVELRAPRHFPEVRPIEIEGLDRIQTLAVDMRPAWGYAEIETLPPGAEVIVAGELRGQTPLKLEILESGEPVVVKLAGYKRWQQELAVAAGTTRELEPIILEPADGLVMVNSSPSGATLLVNGQYLGTTPLEVELQPDRKHQLQLFLDGYQSSKRQISVASGSEQNINVSLQAELGEIHVSTRPAGAQLYVNGKRQGADGDTLKLPARPHQLEVRKDGYRSVTRTILPRPEHSQVLQIQLLTEAEAELASIPRQISTNGITLKLFKPEQTFAMGSSRREQGRRANEIYQQVTLNRPFYLAATETTNQVFKKFHSEHSSAHASGVTLDLPNQPVVRVSWQDAALFCNWLSTAEGLTPFYRVENGRVTGQDSGAIGYRLPTEAEWAWAARMSEDNKMLKYPWGDSLPPPAQAGNYADLSAAKIVGRIIRDYRDGFAASAPVGSFTTNGKGLFDLGGNVAEWVHDYYGIVADIGGKPRENPLGPESGEFRVIRDSSWRQGSITELRLSFRDYGLEPRDDVGFRIARYAQ